MGSARLLAAALGVLLLAATARAAGVPDLPDGVKLPDLIARLMPSVVSISILKAQPGADGVVPTGSQPVARVPIQEFGSGFIIDPDGTIVTNRHVIDGAFKIVVTLNDKRVFPVRVIGTNARPDLAVLKVDVGEPLPAIAWGDSTALVRGNIVLVIGNPLGLAGSVSTGIVSALDRNADAFTIDDYIQTDAALNHGNSGGPLFNLKGEVVGVNWALISPTTNSGSIGIGLSIPERDVRPVIDQIRAKGRATFGWPGMSLQQLSPGLASYLGDSNFAGGIVTGVTPGGPADKAGIRPGEAIFGFRGQRESDVRAIVRDLRSVQPGETRQAVVWSNGAQRVVPLTLGTWPTPPLPDDPSGTSPLPDRGPRVHTPDLGLTLVPMTDAQRQAQGVNGAWVNAVAANSVAADAGFAAGFIVVQVAGQPVTGPDDTVVALDKLRRGGARDTLLLVSTPTAGGQWIRVPLD